MTMNYKLLVYGFALYLIGQILAWVQVYGPLIFPKLKSNAILVCLILSPFIGIVYIYATRYMVEAFDGIMWPSRIIGFSAGVIVFALATSMFMKEGITMKTSVSLILCVAILLIQVFWKSN